MSKVGNAPCSWGTIEGAEGARVPYARMLDELKETGYTGTELGDYGFMPTDPAELREELSRRGLTMLGGYEGVRLVDPGEHGPGRERLIRNARLMAAVADRGVSSGGDSSWSPKVVLADDNGRDPVRFAHAGRVRPEMRLSDDDFRTFARGAQELAAAVFGETGLRTVFHPHCAGFVETPDEIERLLELTEPETLDIVFDTGHFLYGSGSDDGRTVVEGLERFRERIAYVHFKDCDPQVAGRARREGWDYRRAVAAGVFCELGRGRVDFVTVLARLRDSGYDGWITVEQDVLPGMGSPRESALRNREYLKSIGL
jgi:inosose dehydratase